MSKKRPLKTILKSLFYGVRVYGKAQQETLEHGLTIRAFIDQGVRKLILYRTRRIAPSLDGRGRHDATHENAVLPCA